MPRFFIDGTADGRAYIAGADALHIAKALRMRPGEALTLCDGKGTDFDGVLAEGRPNRGRRGCLSGRNLQFDITGYFLSHFFLHLQNLW